jgi:HTH-type transcriptional regulator/antitoxin HigA
MLSSFIVRVRPMYSKNRIVQFANRARIHPGIIVGQLQHRGEIGYAANREMLAKVREIIANSAITDGWGRVVSLE